MRIVPTPTLDCDPAEDRAITAEELEALRLWMRSDGPAHDECPLMDDVYQPSDADALWWSRECDDDEPPPWWDAEVMAPLSGDQNWNSR